MSPSGKRSLLDLLPKPKHRDSKASAVKKRKKAVEGEEVAKPASDAPPEKHLDNEQYRVNTPSVGQASVVGAAVPLREKPPAVDVHSLHNNDNDDGGDDIMKAIEEEQLRRKKGLSNRGDDIEIKEISQDSLKQGVSAVQREVDAIGLALKTDDDEEEKVVMPNYTLSKEAHRKHQITTLYQTMKKNETKLVTKDAQNAKTKRETERKYGWR